MADNATILLQYLTSGDKEMIAIGNQVKAVMDSQAKAAEILANRIGKDYAAGLDKTLAKIKSSSNALSILTSILKQNDTETRISNHELEKRERITERAAIAQKKLADSLQYTTTPLGKFMTNLAGGADKLKVLEANAYSASRMSTLFSQNLVTHPIQTMKAFSSEANKGAIAANYFREQIAFIASSRFGSIIIWGSILTGIITSIKTVISSLVDLDRETKRVESAFAYASKSLKLYDEIQSQMLLGARAFGQSYQDIGTIMWELKSAGLSASATMAGLETNQRLVIAGVSDINNATRLTAGLFRAYGASLAGATNDMERFQRIGDVLAYTLNQSQIDLDGLVQGYKFASSTAELTGLSFEDLSAILGVLNNRMLYGTTAGTSLVNAFIQLSKNWEKVVEKFNVKIDPTKTAASQMMSIIGQLHDRFGDSQLSLQQLSDLFDSFNIRGGRAIAALIKGYPELIQMQDDLSDSLGKVNGSLKDISNTKLDNLGDQWNRFTANVKASLVEIASGTLGLKDAFKGLADWIEFENRFSKIVDKKFSEHESPMLIEFIQKEVFKSKLEELTGDTQKYLELLRQYPEALKIAFQVGPQYFEGIDSLEKLEHALKITSPSANAIGSSFNKATRFIGELGDEANTSEGKLDKLNKILEETRIKLQAIKSPEIIGIEGLKGGLPEIFKSGELYTNIKDINTEIIKSGDSYTNIKDRTQELVNVNGTWMKNLEANKDLLGGITAELALAKANTPAAEIQKTIGLYFESSKALERINAEIDSSDKHTRAVESATKEWGKRAEDVYKLYKQNQKAIDDATKAQDELNKQVQRNVDIHVKYGNLSQYDLQRNLEIQRNAAQWAVLTSISAEEEIKKREALIAINEKLLATGIKDQRINDEIVKNADQVLVLQARIADEKDRQAKETNDYLYSPEAVSAVQDIEEKLKGLPAVMKETNTEAQETNRIIGELQTKTKTITEQTMPLWISQFQRLNKEADELNTKVLTGFGDIEDIKRGSQ